MSFRRHAIAQIVMWLAASAVGAQSPASGDSARGSWSYGAWGGLARNSPASIWGTTGGRDVAVTAFRLARTIAASDHAALDYVLDVVPAAWLSAPPADEGTSYICTLRKGEVLGCRPPRSFQEPPAYGLGGAPLGLAMRLRPTSRIQPFVSASGGMLWFRRPVPNDYGAERNFTLETGGGILLQLPARFALASGYKFYHISNAGTALSNPGLDNHMFYLSVMRLAPARRR